MTACRVRIEEEAYDRISANAEREAIATAVEQLQQVQEVARAILNGHAVIDTRMQRVFVKSAGSYQSEMRSVTFSMKQVADLFAEEITPALCIGLLRGEPSALFSAQKIIGDAAHEVAFDALNLWSSPFTDYSDLMETAVQS